MCKHNMYVAVGDGGFRPVVWGLGSDEDMALEDAIASGDVRIDELVVHEISHDEAEVVQSGDVSWPITVPK